MKRESMVGVGLVVTTVACLLGCGTRRSDEAQERAEPATERTVIEEASPLDPSGLHLETEAESRSRSARVLPNGPSEDARHVLGDPPPAPPRDEGPEEYAPNERVDWYVAVALASGARLSKSAIVGAFDPAWREAQGGARLYGRGALDGRWSLIGAADSPLEYTELRVAWRLVSIDGDLLSASSAADRVAAVARAARALGSATSRPSLEPSEAERRARVIAEVLERFGDSDVQVILAAPDGATYDGVAIWDALTSLGIEWGDGDFFHWENTTETNNDFLFSVGTSTHPGYFFPEDAIARRLRVADLDFGFPLASTHQPGAIFDAMMRAVRYVQRRLGGTILDGERAPLDEGALRARIRADAATLTAAGFAPGSDEASLVF